MTFKIDICQKTNEILSFPIAHIYLIQNINKKKTVSVKQMKRKWSETGSTELKNTAQTIERKINTNIKIGIK